MSEFKKFYCFKDNFQIQIFVCSDFIRVPVRRPLESGYGPSFTALSVESTARVSAYARDLHIEISPHIRANGLFVRALFHQNR